VWRVDDPKNGKHFLIPLEGPIREVIERRLGPMTSGEPGALIFPAWEFAMR